MNHRLVIAGVAALGLVGMAGAQPKPKPGSNTADFVIVVPLVLENMAPEIHSVAVWCEIVNYAGSGTGAGPGRGGYQGQKPAAVIATAGPLIIPVRGYAPRAGAPADKAGQAPSLRPWSVSRIDGEDSRTGARAETTKNSNLDPKSLATLPTAFTITPHTGAANPNAAVILQANSAGATDPALGNAYGCHIAFQATAMIDGKMTEFSIFGTDAGNYNGLPTRSSKSSAASKSSDPSRGGGDPDRVLHVYGDIAPAKR